MGSILFYNHPLRIEKKVAVFHFCTKVSITDRVYFMHTGMENALLQFFFGIRGGVCMDGEAGAYLL